MIKSLFGEEENKEQKQKETSSEAKSEQEDSAPNSLSVIDDITSEAKGEEEKSQVDENEDEIESVEEIKAAIETGFINPPKEETEVSSVYESAVQPFEIDKPIGQPVSERKSEKIETPEILSESAIEEIKQSSRTLELEKQLQELEEELKREKKLELERLNRELAEKKAEIEAAQTKKIESLGEPEKLSKSDEPETIDTLKPETGQTGYNDWDKSDETRQDNWGNPGEIKQTETDQSIHIKPNDYMPESQAEGIRQSGMAWSAAIALFGSVVFMLILGWGADVLLGSTPWGIVLGIVIGSIIGFIQFFRTTSQILKPKPTDFDRVSLRSNFNTDELSSTEEASEVTSIEKKEVIAVEDSAENNEADPVAEADAKSGKPEGNSESTTDEQIDEIIVVDDNKKLEPEIVENTEEIDSKLPESEEIKNEEV